MSDCCSTSTDASNSVHSRCPHCGQACQSVPLKTVLHHLKSPWQLSSQAPPQAGTQTNTQFYFCTTEHCPHIYLTDDGTAIDQSQLRTEVGIKSHSPQRTLCYCYGVNAETADTDPSIRDFVTAQTKLKNCACDSHNPSGRCCLNQFPKLTGNPPHRKIAEQP